MERNWGYDKDNGPETWKVHYPDANGKQQSPVDINPNSNDLETLNGTLVWNYSNKEAVDLTNTGHGWKVQTGTNDAEISGGPLEHTFKLKQIHSHWGATEDQGSEHTLEGHSFAGELHLVHWNCSKYSSFTEAFQHKDGLCVIAVFLKSGEENAELAKICDKIPEIIYEDQSTTLAKSLNIEGLLPHDTSMFFTYSGSLTTPPCSECVTWIVFKNPITVSPEQLAAFRKLRSHACGQSTNENENCVTKNCRPTLPLHNRKVRRCRQ